MTLEAAPNALEATPLIRSHGLGTLERLLDAGWQIEPPVLARLAWAQRDSQRQAYHFVLKRGSQRSLVVITDAPELQRFLIAHNLQII